MTTEEKMMADPVIRVLLEKYKEKQAPQELIDKTGLQTEKGIAEYGQSIGFSSLTVEEMFNYLLEELVDVPIYLIAFYRLFNEAMKHAQVMREALEVIVADTKAWTNPDETIPYVNKIAREALAE